MELQIIDMLQADIPVVASHNVYLNENKLVYYKGDMSMLQMDMKLRDKETWIYFFIYTVVIIFRYIFIYGVKDINPFTLDYSNEGWLSIYVTFEQFAWCLPIFFILAMIYVLIKKVCTTEVLIFSKLYYIALWIYTILCFLSLKYSWGNAIYCVFMLIFFKSMMKHLKTWYSKVKIRKNIKRKNIPYVIIVFLVLLIVNVIYVLVPRDTIYLYEKSGWGAYLENNLNSDCFKEICRFDILPEDSDFGGHGWIIEAKKTGEYEVKIYDTPYIVDDLEKFIQSQEIDSILTVNENFKFTNIVDLEYLLLFYPLNVYLFIYCSIYIILLTIEYFATKMKE